jgi:hypothetical protein
LRRSRLTIFCDTSSPTESFYSPGVLKVFGETGVALSTLVSLLDYERNNDWTLRLDS